MSQLVLIKANQSVISIFFPFLSVFVLLMLAGQCYAVNIAIDKDEKIEDARSGWLPYAFRTDSLGTAVGVGFFSAGRNQPQSSIVGTGYVTSNDSQLLMGALTNLQLVGSGRVFFDIFGLVGHFTDQRFYVDLDHDPTQAKAGSNESDQNDFVSGVSNDIQLELTVKYPLALGNSRTDPVSVYYLDKGLLHSGPRGGVEYSPVESGKTLLAATFFHKYRDLDEISQDELLSVNTNGIKLWLDHNNTDFPRNPSNGSRQKITVTRDFGWLDRSDTWTNLELEIAKYLDLGNSKLFRQRVLAFNFWTSNTTSWQRDENNDQIVNHRPPPGIGSSLGGYDRMRAYPIGRFHDKAAVYYAAELRLIPRLNPLRDLPLLNYFDIDWMQFVGFVEAGRVAPNYDSELYFEDLKYDAGLSLRLMTFKAVVRLDIASSEEGNSIWAMYEQTFAR